MTSNEPIYNAKEIKKMALIFDLDMYGPLVEQINDDLDLYSSEDLIIIVQASMIIFVKTLLSRHLIK